MVAAKPLIRLTFPAGTWRCPIGNGPTHQSSTDHNLRLKRLAAVGGHQGLNLTMTPKHGRSSRTLSARRFFPVAASQSARPSRRYANSSVAIVVLSSCRSMRASACRRSSSAHRRLHFLRSRDRNFQPAARRRPADGSAATGRAGRRQAHLVLLLQPQPHQAQRVAACHLLAHGTVDRRLVEELPRRSRILVRVIDGEQHVVLSQR